MYVGAHLGQASLLGPHGHLVGIGLGHATILLTVLLVLCPYVAWGKEGY